MNKRRIDTMIPLAIDILRNQSDIVDTSTTPPSIASKYHGYMASYGPTIIQTGLLQAVLFYEGREGRPQINKLLKKVFMKVGVIASDDERKLFDILQESPAYKWQTLFFEAITACKLAMRTFKKTQEGGDADE